MIMSTLYFLGKFHDEKMGNLKSTFVVRSIAKVQANSLICTRSMQKKFQALAYRLLATSETSCGDKTWLIVFLMKWGNS